MAGWNLIACRTPGTLLEGSHSLGSVIELVGTVTVTVAGGAGAR